MIPPTLIISFHWKMCSLYNYGSYMSKMKSSHPWVVLVHRRGGADELLLDLKFVFPLIMIAMSDANVPYCQRESSFRSCVNGEKKETALSPELQNSGVLIVIRWKPWWIQVEEIIRTWKLMNCCNHERPFWKFRMELKRREGGRPLDIVYKPLSLWNLRNYTTSVL